MTNFLQLVEVGRGKVLVLLRSLTPGRQWKICNVPLWRWSHVNGLEIHCGFDAEAVEMRVEPLLCPVAADVRATFSGNPS
jgi:hypothetical protein